MKTIKEIYGEILRDKELREEFIDAVGESKQEEFFASQGCDATADDISNFFESETVIFVACELLKGLSWSSDLLHCGI